MPVPKRVSFKDAKRLVNVLYPVLAEKSRQALPLVRSTLQSENGLQQLKANFPKDLKQLEISANIGNLKPLSEAVSLIPSGKSEVLSNVLLFRTRNQLLHKTDFVKLAPIQSSSFDWSSSKEKRLFDVVQARLPNLLPRGNYYLIFKDSSEAASYVFDTIGKELNGSNVYLQMVDPKEHSVYISQKLLQETFDLDEETNTLRLHHAKPRRHFVLVKGIPTFIQRSTLKQILWDFELDYQYDPIINLGHDQIAKIGMWLLTFENQLEALRYVRRFNGKHFNNEPHLSKVYASVLS